MLQSRRAAAYSEVECEPVFLNLSKTSKDWILISSTRQDASFFLTFKDFFFEPILYLTVVLEQGDHDPFGLFGYFGYVTNTIGQIIKMQFFF